jgi:hypothetical protein
LFRPAPATVIPTLKTDEFAIFRILAVRFYYFTLRILANLAASGTDYFCHRLLLSAYDISSEYNKKPAVFCAGRRVLLYTLLCVNLLIDDFIKHSAQRKTDYKK